MTEPLSIAIETSCRQGGIALARGDKIVADIEFVAQQRHATQLVARLADLLRQHSLRPGDLNEVYVSAGPGSFTGLRVGVTVTRTLAQALPHLRCVAVPTAAAVAENARDLPWQDLAVILDAKEELVFACMFARRDGQIAPGEQGIIATVGDLLARTPRPLTVTGEGLEHHEVAGEGVLQAPPELRLPTAQGVWRVGYAMARRGTFTEYHQLLPVYTRKPEAVRLWEKRFGPRDA